MTHHINTLNLTPMTPPTDVLTVLDGEGIFSGPLRRVALLIASQGIRSESAITWDTTSVEVADVAGVTPRTFRNWVKAIRQRAPRALDVHTTNHGTTLVLHLSDRKWIGSGPEMDRKPLGNGPEADRKRVGSGTDDATCPQASSEQELPTEALVEVVAGPTPPTPEEPFWHQFDEGSVERVIQEGLETAGYEPFGAMALDTVAGRIRARLEQTELRAEYIRDMIAKCETKGLARRTVVNVLTNDIDGWLAARAARASFVHAPTPARTPSNAYNASPGYDEKLKSMIEKGTSGGAEPSVTHEQLAERRREEIARKVWKEAVKQELIPADWGWDEAFAYICEEGWA